MADIYVFGDSIGYGAVDVKGGWADRLKQYLHKQKTDNPEGPFTEVYNLSVDGDTSSDVARRIKNELAVRRKPWSTPEDLVVIAIGDNDACAEGSPDGYKASTEEYQNNLNIIYEVVKSFDLEIAFVGLVAVDETKANPCVWGEYYIKNDRVELFDKVQLDFCKDNHASRIELFPITLLSEYQKNLFDGVHPNSNGHKILFEQIQPFITQLLQK
ncbi:hypothetical protein A3F37_01355 [Candidatus Saccharibacteria bacterium RIFCSPHIGHO2_12_FULL_41_12]|nr:MAG: hypothetical protein A3F37_01355 [Candidatus Saccharibacteria bacterium RIFCSPHIGHO2_12_FULL_41_12]